MFSDRNLYRPAETMHLKGIMRTLLDNKLSVTPVEEVQLTIGTVGSVKLPSGR